MRVRPISGLAVRGTRRAGDDGSPHSRQTRSFAAVVAVPWPCAPGTLGPKPSPTGPLTRRACVRRAAAVARMPSRCGAAPAGKHACAQVAEAGAMLCAQSGQAISETGTGRPVPFRHHGAAPAARTVRGRAAGAPTVGPHRRGEGPAARFSHVRTQRLAHALIHAHMGVNAHARFTPPA